jgi:type IV secretion system protein VirB9
VTDFGHVAAALLLTAAISGAAYADPRTSDRLYAANQIVTVHGKPGIESAIAFAADERIENIAVGNSTIWQVNPNKRANVLFVKPTTARARTNMTVITNQRTYLFDLVSSSSGSPVYMLQFKYPDAPAGAPAVAQPAPTAVAEAQGQLRPRSVPAELNFSWRGAGEKRLLPASYFDDGSSTFLRWTADMPLPAILVRGSDGAEGPVNYTVQGDYIVVEGIPSQLVLRSGKQVATLTPLRRPPLPIVTARAAQLRVETAARKTDQ